MHAYYYYNAQKKGNGSGGNERTLVLIGVAEIRTGSDQFGHVFEGPSARSDTSSFTYHRSNVNPTLMRFQSKAFVDS